MLCQRIIQQGKVGDDIKKDTIMNGVKVVACDPTTNTTIQVGHEPEYERRECEKVLSDFRGICHWLRRMKPRREVPAGCPSADAIKIALCRPNHIEDRLPMLFESVCEVCASCGNCPRSV